MGKVAISYQATVSKNPQTTIYHCRVWHITMKEGGEVSEVVGPNVQGMDD